MVGTAYTTAQHNSVSQYVNDVCLGSCVALLTAEVPEGELVKERSITERAAGGHGDRLARCCHSLPASNRKVPLHCAAAQPKHPFLTSIIIIDPTYER